MRRPDEIQRSLKALTRKGIDFIQGDVTGIFPERKTIAVNDNPVKYDYLIISLGAELKKIFIQKQKGHTTSTALRVPD